VRSIPTTPGERIGGKYEIVRVLGSGAQGVVVEALHLGLAQRVALKFLHPAQLEDRAVVARFEREARNAAALRSVHAPRVHDVDQIDGLPFIVEELLEGRSLAEEIRQNGPLPINRAVDYVRQACAAIAEAHERGIVHRDIKASNVFLALEGAEWTAKVLDFGVSRAKEQALDAEEVGTVVGSPRWMSPEQISDPASADARTDIWSLGILLFHALTGVHPFDQKDVRDILYAILTEAPKRPSDVRAEIPVALEAEILRALAKEPSRRQASVKELAKQLAPFGSPRVSAQLASCIYLSSPGQSCDVPPSATTPHAQTPQTNVALPATRFFGRDADLARLARLIDEGRRVLTLLGPAGAGKTRLALEFARQRAHEGGVWFCDLTEARDVDGVIVAVGHALQVSLASVGSEQALIDQIARSVAARGDTLIILDNCEQVVDAAARVVARISELAPHATEIATSRERLRVPGEQVHLVASLGADGDLASNDAVRLFIDRATSVDSGFAPTPADVIAIADVVRRLDGLPLAIELAAARMGMLGLQEIHERLEERFKLLAGGSRLVPERQRTMRGAIDWSWDLLDAHERAALAQCAVFRGGFSLDAAERVVELAPSAPPVLDVLQSLSEKSLLSATEHPELGERRYRLFESVRAYALEELRTAGEEATLDRHARYFATSGAIWATAAAKGEATKPRERLAVELENVLGAHRHALARAPTLTNVAFTLLRPIAELLKSRGPLDLLLSLLDATLADPHVARVDPSLIAEALRDRAVARHFAPETASAKIEDLTRALEIARITKDVTLELSCLSVFASVELLHGKPESARQHVRVAVDRARAHGDPRALAKAYADLGACDLAMGRLEEARACMHEAIALSRPTGDRLETARHLARMSEALLQLGRLDEARACIDEGFDLARPFKQNRLLALLSGIQAVIAYERDDLAGAHAAFVEAFGFAETAGAALLQPFYRACLGSVLADMDDVAHAEEEIAAAEAMLPRFADDPVLGVTVAFARGHLDLARGRTAAAAGDVKAELSLRVSAGKRLDVQHKDFEDLRIMRRRLERALARASGTLMPTGESEHEGALVVDAEGHWFRAPGGERVDISQRPNLRRLLVSLVVHRIGARGEPLSLAAIFRAGWPGERANDDSVANRARVALARLRKLGLEDVLLTKGGYYLDPEVNVVIARPGSVAS